MQNFNLALFSLYEHMYVTYSELHGSEYALKFMEKLFAKALGKAYLAAGFSKGNVDDFSKVVKERDEGVGLPVEFPLVTPNKIIYRFHKDPFPNLKNVVSASELDSTYMNFKVKFLLGEQWAYTTTHHIWDGHPFTEHVIYFK